MEKINPEKWLKVIAVKAGRLPTQEEIDAARGQISSWTANQATNCEVTCQDFVLIIKDGEFFIKLRDGRKHICNGKTLAILVVAERTSFESITRTVESLTSTPTIEARPQTTSCRWLRINRYLRWFRERWHRRHNGPAHELDVLEQGKWKPIPVNDR